jgi:uncharacterized cupredoxin-like copper-binding protein
MPKLRKLVAVSLIAVGGAALAHTDEGHTAAFGQPGDPNKVSRTVDITMNDTMRFSPASVAVKRNETIRFALKNEGKLKHEMVLGTFKELKAHAALMIKFPQMEHADPNQASVEAGKSGELVWRFTKAGTFDFACLQAGHYEAGMKGQVVVSVAAAQDATQPARTADIVLVQAAATEMAEGEVRKVDKDAGKLTLKHGEIKNLDMPSMTMVFAVKDKALLEKLQAGDKVRFKAVSDNGKITITDIEMAK